MEIPAALLTDLASLTDALDGQAGDVAPALDRLLLDVEIAVPSFLGLIVIVVVDDQPICFTALPPAPERPPIEASFGLPLPLISASEHGSTLTFYAATRGAFVDLAADLSYALQVDLTALDLDTDLTPAATGATVLDATHINQAIGILIDRGHTAAAAHIELGRLAADTGRSRQAAARLLIASLIAPTTPAAE